MPVCDHVAFRVHDLERSISFYTRLLPGRSLGVHQGDDVFRSRIAWIQPDGHDDFRLVLIQATRVRWLLRLLHALVPRAFRSFEHVGFRCDSREEVDGRARVAEEVGARVLFGPHLVSDHVGYLFEIRDPDGNAIEWTCGKTLGPPEPKPAGP